MTRTNARRTLAAVDIGSSSIKYALYDVAGDGAPPLLLHETDPVATHLGKGLTPGAPLPAEARARTLDVLRAFRADIDARGGRTGIVVATQAVRIAADRASFLAAVRDVFGSHTPVGTISGEDEARLSFLSVATTLGPFHGPILNLDPGGSSNDLAYGRGETAERVLSIPFGMNHLVQVSDPETSDGRIDAESMTRLEDFVREKFAPVRDLVADRHPPRALTATSGAVIAVANVWKSVSLSARHERSMAAHGVAVPLAAVRAVARAAAPLTTAERRRLWPCLSSARAPIFVHGCVVYAVLLEVLGLDAVWVNGYGLKFGVLMAAERGTLELRS